MLVDNNTVACFMGNYVPTDGFCKITWRSKKGREEWIREQYINDFGGYIFYDRTLRSSSLYVKRFDNCWWYDTNFILEWRYEGKTYYMLKYKDTYTIRTSPFDERFI